MSNETDDTKPHNNSSFESQDIFNNSPRDTDHNVSTSRASSASKKNKGQQSTFDNEYSNEKRIKSPSISRQNTNQFNNNKLTNENQSSLNSLDNEEQSAFHNRSRSSFPGSEPNNDEPTMDNHHLLSSHNEQNVHTDDANQENLRQPQNITYTSDPKKLPDSISNEQKIDVSNSNKPEDPHPACQFRADKKWLDPQYHAKKTSKESNESEAEQIEKSDESETELIKKPNELEDEMNDPPRKIDAELLDRIQGSIIGMALGDALGAHVEFRPYQYMKDHPVTKLEGGGTWGLEKGQFTDDTSMALCLANSLLARRDFIPYDQLVRYKWWYKSGYMSSTGQCFDIGAATSQSLREFEHRQKKFAAQYGIPFKQLDQLSDTELLSEFDVYCSEDDVAGNGALMRLAPVPLFFYRDKYAAIEFSGRSGVITHGDKKAYDACRFYGALIVAVLRGHTKDQILAKNFYSDHKHWFGEEPLHIDIIAIAEGSYKKKAIYPQPKDEKTDEKTDESTKAAKLKPVCERLKGKTAAEKTKILEHAYDAGVRGKGYIVSALEAALWAFWTEDSFEGGALAAVNLGDDTDTTAAIYGQLAGAWYGYKNLPKEWLKHVYAKKFMETLSKWIAYEGEQWHNQRPNSAIKRS